jgi:hypothetical protein
VKHEHDDGGDVRRPSDLRDDLGSQVMNSITLIILAVAAFCGPNWLYGSMIVLGAIGLLERFV